MSLFRKCEFLSPVSSTAIKSIEKTLSVVKLVYNSGINDLSISVKIYKFDKTTLKPSAYSMRITVRHTVPSRST